jgi:excisionase family DNA binding protein
MKPGSLERDDPFRSAKTLLNVIYPGSFPRLPCQKEESAPEKTSDYMNFEEATEYLRLTERQLRDLCRERNITHIRIDYRTYRFNKSDLDLPTVPTGIQPVGSASSYGICFVVAGCVARAV